MSTRTRPATTGLLLRTPPAPSRGPSGRRTAAVVVAAVACVLLLAGAALAVAEHDRIPAGTSIGGVDVGGKTERQAAVAVRRTAERKVAQPISLVFAGGPASITGIQLGAKPRIETAVARAADAGVLARLKARIGLGGGRRVALRFALEPSRIERLVDELDARVAEPATNATVSFAGSEAKVTEAVSGAQVDRGALVSRLQLLPPSAVVPVRSVPPLVSTAAARRAKQLVDRLLSEPRTVALGSESVTLGPKLLRSALRFEPGDGGLRVRLDKDVLSGRLTRALKGLEQPARDARFVIASGGGVGIIPSASGRRLDIERIANSIVGNLRATTHRARLVTLAPAFTTEDARKLQITDLVSEFTTYYPCCAPRVTNIKRAAELLDGTVVRPGEQFSLNDALGQRTEEKGFVSAPQIRAGRLEDSVGGGISQVATTLYNAAFFAGLRLDAHQAHQFYISRYPMGREATVSWGGPELIFTNDWRAGLLIKVYADDGSITVRFYSSKLGRRVETATGEPYAFRAPTTIVTRNNALAPGERVVEQEAGASGFTVQYTREVYRGDKRIKDERYTVRYDPQDAYIEEGPPKKPPKKPAKPKKEAGKGDAPTASGPDGPATDAGGGATPDPGAAGGTTAAAQ